MATSQGDPYLLNMLLVDALARRQLGENAPPDDEDGDGLFGRLTGFGRRAVERVRPTGGALDQFLTGVGRGTATAFTGAGELIGRAIPGEDIFEKGAARIRQTTEQERERAGEPRTTGQRIAAGAGRVVGEALPAIVPAASAARALSTAPRALRAAGTAAAAFTPDFAVGAGLRPEESAAGALGELTGSETLKDISGDVRLRALAEGLTGLGAAGAVTGAARAAKPIAQAVAEPFTSVPKFLHARGASMLSNPTSRALDFASNLLMSGLETAKDVPAAAFDRVLSRRTGLVTKSAPSLRTARATAGAMKQGARNMWREIGGPEAIEALGTTLQRGGDAPAAWEAFRNRLATQPQAGRFLEHEPIRYQSKLADIAFNLPYKMTTIPDQMFKPIAYRRSLEDQARALARQEGLKGRALNERARDIVRLPTDAMEAQAVADAEFATFMNKGELAQTLSDATRKWPALRLVTPFVRTTANVAGRVVDYSPLGLARAGKRYQEFARALTKQEGVSEAQRKLAEQLGRTTTGMGAIGLGLAFKDRILPAWENASREERRMMQQTGEPFFSIRIGDKAFPMDRLEPFSALMLYGAELGRFLEEEGAGNRLNGLLFQTAVAPARAAFQASPLPGAEEAFAILGEEDPKAEAALGRYLEGQFASLVPSAVGRIAQATDPLQREAEGAVERVQSRIPGLSRELPAKLDPFGEPIERRPSGVRALVHPLLPVPRIKDDALREELGRVGLGIAPLSGGRARKGESREAFHERQALVGPFVRQTLEDVLESERYRSRLDRALKKYPGQDPDEVRRRVLASQKEELAKAVTDRRTAISNIMRSDRYRALTRERVQERYPDRDPDEVLRLARQRLIARTLGDQP